MGIGRLLKEGFWGKDASFRDGDEDGEKVVFRVEMSKRPVELLYEKNYRCSYMYYIY